MPPPGVFVRYGTIIAPPGGICGLWGVIAPPRGVFAGSGGVIASPPFPPRGGCLWGMWQ